MHGDGCDDAINRSAVIVLAAQSFLD